MILLLDNNDSFVHNLARYIQDLGEEVRVIRSDTLSTGDIARLAPSRIVISPGPGTPADAGVSVEAVRRFGATIPILGICLGHQCVAAAYGLRIVRAGAPRHGKASSIRHRSTGLFAGLPNPFEAGRYHSLVVDPGSVYGDIEIVATSEDQEIMALRHRRQPTWGLQFHPESILTSHGYHLLHRFLWPGTAVPADVPAAADRVTAVV
jgi:anthranilate synthase/aminodeoxychorismate synthase-like glutamine amidotransferase